MKKNTKKLNLSNAFKDKRILITGITGFVGTKLAEKLQDLGTNVYGVSRSKSSKNIVKGNITDYDFLDRFVKKNKIQICFHLAGEALVENGHTLPYETFKTNVVGTLNVLEIARKRNLERIILSSSSHVYGRNKVPYSEGYSPRPSRPYETSKASTDLISLSYANSFDLPLLIPRFVNIYGPGDLHFTRLIPKTIKSVILGEKPKMWGGRSMRDYLFLDDAVNAYLMLGAVDFKKLKSSRVFNIGSDNLISVKDLIRKIIRISGRKILIEKISDERELEIDSQHVSWKRARNLLDWEPQYRLDAGLGETYAWYQDHFSKRMKSV